MSVSKAELAEILARSIDEEFAFAVKEAEKEPHEFSEEHEAKMAELIKTGKPNDKKGLSKRGRRILVIAVAALLALTAVACAVPQIRKSIAGFFVQEFGNHDEFTRPDMTKSTIEEEYGIVPVPEGYKLTEEMVADLWISRTYMDDDNNSIILEQYAGDPEHMWTMVDNEHGENYEKEIAGKTVLIHFAEDGCSAYWVENGYYFFFGAGVIPLDKDTFEEWIASVQIVDSDPQ